jgi:phosphate:Na+ symporter
MLERDRDKLEEIQKMDDRVDILQGEILRYLGALRTRHLTERESEGVGLAMLAADEFESIGDTIETDLVGLCFHALDEDIQASDATRYLFHDLGDKITAALELTVRAVRDLDQLAAEEVITMKKQINKVIRKALAIQLAIQAAALAEVGGDQIEAIRMEMTVLENLKRIHTYLKRIASKIVPLEVAG